MHSYILLKYYHRQLLELHISLLHVSIRADHHQGVLLVLAKLLIKNYKIKRLKICMFGDAAAYAAASPNIQLFKRLI